MGELACMDSTGDTKLIWSKNNADEVEVAEQTYKSLKAKGFGAFAVNKKGDAAGRIDEFDPNAERIIMVPQLQGGFPDEVK